MPRTAHTKTLIRSRTCRSCGTSHPAGRLLHGQCPRCAHLAPLLLRDTRGRFARLRAATEPTTA